VGRKVGEGGGDEEARLSGNKKDPVVSQWGSSSTLDTALHATSRQ